jgi:hypothetical protein
MEGSVLYVSLGLPCELSQDTRLGELPFDNLWIHVNKPTRRNQRQLTHFEEVGVLSAINVFGRDFRGGCPGRIAISLCGH